MNGRDDDRVSHSRATRSPPVNWRSHSQSDRRRSNISRKQLGSSTQRREKINNNPDRCFNREYLFSNRKVEPITNRNIEEDRYRQNLLPRRGFLSKREDERRKISTEEGCYGRTWGPSRNESQNHLSCEKRTVLSWRRNEGIDHTRGLKINVPDRCFNSEDPFERRTNDRHKRSTDELKRKRSTEEGFFLSEKKREDELKRKRSRTWASQNRLSSEERIVLSSSRDKCNYEYPFTPRTNRNRENWLPGWQKREDERKRSTEEKGFFSQQKREYERHKRWTDEGGLREDELKRKRSSEEEGYGITWASQNRLSSDMNRRRIGGIDLSHGQPSLKCGLNRQETDTVNRRVEYEQVSRNPREKRNLPLPLLPSSSVSVSATHPLHPIQGRLTLPIKVEPVREPLKPASWLHRTNSGCIHTIVSLQNKGVSQIDGTLKCSRCKKFTLLSFHLTDAFNRQCNFFQTNKVAMGGNADALWNDPKRFNCEHCHGQQCLSMDIPSKLDDLDLLFLFCSNMLGTLSIPQMQHCLKAKGIPHSGKRKEVLYKLYLHILKVLFPRIEEKN